MLSKPYFLYNSLPTPTAYCSRYAQKMKVILTYFILFIFINSLCSDEIEYNFNFTLKQGGNVISSLKNCKLSNEVGRPIGFGPEEPTLKFNIKEPSGKKYDYSHKKLIGGSFFINIEGKMTGNTIYYNGNFSETFQNTKTQNINSVSFFQTYFYGITQSGNTELITSTGPGNMKLNMTIGFKQTKKKSITKP